MIFKLISTYGDSESFSNDAVGSAPGERMKITGVLSSESFHNYLTVTFGGSKYC